MRSGRAAAHDHPVEDHRRQRHQLQPLAIDRGDAFERAPRQAGDDLQKAFRRAAGHGVLVDDMQRVLRLLHVQPGDAPATPRRPGNKRPAGCRRAADRRRIDDARDGLAENRDLGLSPSSASRNGPSGSDMPSPIGRLPLPSMRTSSTLPPPRSPTTQRRRRVCRRAPRQRRGAPPPDRRRSAPARRIGARLRRRIPVRRSLRAPRRWRSPVVADRPSARARARQSAGDWRRRVRPRRGSACRCARCRGRALT